MDYSILDFLTLIGSLGMFLYGMKTMSEALQKVAGDKMRSILTAMTSNRFKGVMTGILITAIIQSSSATTVMLVSFVNAGLLSLVQSVGVIMGANIGTTVTAWLITILGFKVKISVIALPLIGFGFPLIFSKNNTRRSWGEFIIGFSLIFMGLEFLKSSVPDIKSNPEILSFLSQYTDAGVLSFLFFLFIGTLLTVIVQSSSATMALTLVMCYNGWISFEMAAAMVLGENIGTTITANIAAFVANVSAKRTARAHFLFNLFGVIWIALIFPYFLGGINKFVISLGSDSPFESATAIPFALSIFHTTFNILNVLFLIGFVPLIARIAEFLVKQDDNDEEEFRLKHINTGLLSTTELSIIQAKKEIALFSKRANKMFGRIPQLLIEQKNKNYNKIIEKIYKTEDILDNMEVEIAEYLTKISESDLSQSSSHRIRAMLKIIDEIESIGDCCLHICENITAKNKSKIWFTQDMRDNINKMFSYVNEALSIMHENLSGEYHNVTTEKAIEAEKKINDFRDILKKEHMKKLEENKYPNYKAAMFYNNIITLSEKTGDFIINITESIDEYNSAQ